MFVITRENGKEQYKLTEFTADSEEDIKNLPTNVLVGSYCIVIETSEVYMLNSKKEWKKL